MRHLVLVGVLFLSGSPAIGAGVYRWVDANGIVNYGSEPPAGVKAHAIDGGKSPVSVVPAPPKAAAPTADQHAELRARIGRLETQLEEERRLQAIAQAAEADRLAAARADCEAQRRLNCELDPYGYREPVILVHPVRRPVFTKPGHPPFHPPPTHQGEKRRYEDETPRAVRRR